MKDMTLMLFFAIFLSFYDVYTDSKKELNVFECWTYLRNACSERYLRRRVVEATYNTTFIDREVEVSVECKESKDGLYCGYANTTTMWFRCYLKSKKIVQAEYKSTHYLLTSDPTEVNSICKTNKIIKEFSKRNPAEPLDDYDWTDMTELHQCFKTLYSTCTTRYLSGKTRYFKMSTPIKRNGVSVQADCSEDYNGVICEVNKRLWFKCMRVRTFEVFLIYEKDLHQSASEFEGICSALVVLRTLSEATGILVPEYVPPEKWDRRRILEVTDCRTKLRNMCSERYLRYRVVSSNYTTSATLRGAKVDAFCTEDESGMYCRYDDDKPWFRCYCRTESVVGSVYGNSGQQSILDFDGVCEAVRVFEEVTRHRPAEPLFTIDWSSHRALHTCFKTLNYTCNVRYLSGGVYPNDYGQMVYLRDEDVTAYCKEDDYGVNCTANGQLWFKCFRVRQRQVFLVYEKELHSKATEYAGICTALEVFQKLIKYSEEKQRPPGMPKDYTSYLVEPEAEDFFVLKYLL